ncbi:peptidylprolyl isomerase [Denitromonas ohlonensis]|uniref:Chaperone SurA n=2 Tax=Denitromonas TaxID=139331 RepID=A0A557R5F7_9RHOO|nr:peptidylprolyl isomerase [Denitromonas ohlonensis]TVO60378.1 molecular chaperone SurA [Denitromonas ohlonensis]TVO78543.1 molecular chaperone SurA [Denitromonas ohlonensis]TVT75594.1 MAG: molecular chaperone SurA [Denitromonas halophila]
MKTALSRLLSTLIFSALAVSPAVSSAARTVLVDRIVAVVNNDAITESSLSERTEQIKRQFGRQGGQLPPDDVLRKQVLERLVVERAQLQLAGETGLRIDDNALGGAIDRIASSNKLSAAQFRAALEKDGIDWTEFRENIRQEMLIARLREREVDARVVVTDAEIDNFLKNSPDAADSREYDLSHILLRAPEGPSPEQLNALGQKAEGIRARVLAGEDFAKLAAEFSNAPDALQGGALGWRPSSSVPALFIEALQGLKPGEVSPVMRSPAGFHLVKVNDVRGAKATDVVAVQQTRVSHILVKPTELISDTDARLRLETLRTRVLNGEDFAALARANSADLSATKGGEIGWVYPGDTVPEFERAMDALSVGELSAPVKSPFGWHLIRVEERRTQDVSEERKRAVARNTLRQRKADEAYEDWLRQLRDATFVDYRLDDLN